VDRGSFFFGNGGGIDFNGRALKILECSLIVRRVDCWQVVFDFQFGFFEEIIGAETC